MGKAFNELLRISGRDTSKKKFDQAREKHLIYPLLMDVISMSLNAWNAKHSLLGTMERIMFAPHAIRLNAKLHQPLCLMD